MMKLFSNWRIIWQKKPASPLPISETTKEGYVSQQEATPYKDSLLRSCKEISLATFIECYCNDNFQGLGKGTAEEIEEAWTAIVSEWSELMKNENSEHLLSIESQILSLRAQITFVDYATFLLLRQYDQEIIDKLIGLGYPGEYPENDRAAYVKQLDLAVSLSKRKVFDLNELIEERDRLEKNSGGGRSGEDDFEKSIARLSKYQGYRIDKHKTTVYEYTNIHTNFIDEIKANNQNRGPDN